MIEKSVGEIEVAYQAIEKADKARKEKVLATKQEFEKVSREFQAAIREREQELTKELNDWEKKESKILEKEKKKMKAAVVKLKAAGKGAQELMLAEKSAWLVATSKGQSQLGDSSLDLQKVVEPSWRMPQDATTCQFDMGRNVNALKNELKTLGSLHFQTTTRVRQVSMQKN